MKRLEEVELTNMCMIYDGEGKVVVQDKKNSLVWQGWSFPGGHVEKNEYVISSVIREVLEETGLTIENPKLCGIKEFYTQNHKRYIVFLYIATKFHGQLKDSKEGHVFWYPLEELINSKKLIDDFADMLPVFLKDDISELCYDLNDDSKFYYY